MPSCDAPISAHFGLKRNRPSACPKPLTKWVLSNPGATSVQRSLCSVSASGRPELPGYYESIEQADDDCPFRLVAAPARNFLNSSFSETPTSQKREGRPTALIHPDDCAALDIDEGGQVRLGNKRGSVVVHAKLFDGVQRGVVVVESLWPNAAFVEGMGINVLIGADPVRPNGGAAFHDTAIWLQAA